MLSRLRLINFRRHVDTELDFSDDAQIIAVTGANGAGKSTILEALTYALYGESRHGRRYLAKMVRRAAVHEGLQVELAFTVAGVEYDITRRYEKGKSSAVLFAGGNMVMQSVDGVTAEVSKILGMDSVGFRLAVIAQQFDVDGLADLTPARRRATISRLLRQDALTSASKNARDIYNRELDIVRALGAGPDMDALAVELSLAQDGADRSAASSLQSRKVLAELDAQVAATSDVEASWHQGQLALAAAEATSAAAAGELARLRSDQAQLRVPGQLDAPERDAAQITVEISEVNVAIARGELARERAADAAATSSDLDLVAAALTRLDEELAGETPATSALAVTKAGSECRRLEGQLEVAQEAREKLRVALALLEGEAASLAHRAEQAASLGEVCDACEQTISAQHRSAQEAARCALQESLGKRREATLAELASVDAGHGAAADALKAARAEHERLSRHKERLGAVLTQRTDLTRRREQYQARLSRIVVEQVDVESLFERKGRLEVAKAQAEQYEQVRRAREAALERSAHLSLAIADAQNRFEAATALRAAAEPGDDLVAAYARRRELLEQRRQEADLAAAVETDAAACAERVRSVQRAVDAAASAVAKAKAHRVAADTAAKAAQVLTETAAQMASLIRPQLEGEIAVVLQQLSEGRFNSVRVSPDYEITVEDDGSFEPVSEFSGGESVLIALATRLALANVVASRQGSANTGFLILDEVFGSQDGQRRDAIMAGLRALRASYGQILLISHVGGLEEGADRVVEVRADLVDGQRVAEITAA